MTRAKRTNHRPNVKASAALEAIRGEKTMTEIAAKYGVHPNQIQRWKKQLEENAVNIFGANEKAIQNTEKTIEQLHVKIGQLIPIPSGERDFLSKALGS